MWCGSTPAGEIKTFLTSANDFVFDLLLCQRESHQHKRYEKSKRLLNFFNKNLKTRY